MKRLFICILLLCPPSVLGQEPAVPVRAAFDVASIKETPPPTESIRAGQFRVGVTVNGSRADYGFMSLADLIPYAYRVKPFQLSGPNWLNETRWDIVAKIPEGQSLSRAPEMMQRLLAERFKLSVHHENREQSVYALVVGRGGPKLKEAAAQEEADGGGGLSVRMNNDSIAIGGSATGAVRLTAGSNGGMQMQMPTITMSALADRLTQFMDRPVVDATALTGIYQVTLDVPPDAMAGMAFTQKLAAFAGSGAFGTSAGAADTGNAIIRAVKALGLDLQSRKAPVETIIVDRLDKRPTEN